MIGARSGPVCSRWLAAVAMLCTLAACSGARPEGGGDPRVRTRTIVERTPQGTRTRVITTRVVEAPPPPDRPADPYPKNPLVRYNVELLNEYRRRAGVRPLKYDAKISAFALAGSRELAANHRAHAHFARNAKGSPVLGTKSAENQGDPNGVPPLDRDPIESGKKQIALLLKLMFDEGPGGGHHDNMLNPAFRRVGIGLYESGGRLYLTNDFSN
jgi:hypothetical protein